MNDDDMLSGPGPVEYRELSSRMHRATKRYDCDLCGNSIKQGDLYTSVAVAWIPGNTAYRVKECRECRELCVEKSKS